MECEIEVNLGRITSRICTFFILIGVTQKILTLNILIVEDHPLVSEAYSSVFSELKENQEINYEISSAYNCIEALYFLDEFKKKQKQFHLCILDLRLNDKVKDDDASYKIAHCIRENFIACKLVIITSITDVYTISEVNRRFNPEGFIIKSDSSFSYLKKTFSLIVNGSVIYSTKISAILNKSIAQFSIDHRDLRILNLMNQGYSLKDIGNQIGLSLSGVEYRKRIIAQNIGAPSSIRGELLQYAKEKLHLL